MAAGIAASVTRGRAVVAEGRAVVEEVVRAAVRAAARVVVSVAAAAAAMEVAKAVVMVEAMVEAAEKEVVVGRPDAHRSLSSRCQGRSSCAMHQAHRHCSTH